MTTNGGRPPRKRAMGCACPVEGPGSMLAALPCSVGCVCDVAVLDCACRASVACRCGACHDGGDPDASTSLCALIPACPIRPGSCGRQHGLPRKSFGSGAVLVGSNRWHFTLSLFLRCRPLVHVAENGGPLISLTPDTEAERGGR